MSKKKETMEFRIDTKNFLEEIASSAIPKQMGVLYFPLNLFKSIIADVAKRATELNDPEMNILMLRLGLYNVSHETIPNEIENQKKRLKNDYHNQTPNQTTANDML